MVSQQVNVLGCEPSENLKIKCLNKDLLCFSKFYPIKNHKDS